MGAGAPGASTLLALPPLNTAESRCQQDRTGGIRLGQHMCWAGLVLTALEL